MFRTLLSILLAGLLLVAVSSKSALAIQTNDDAIAIEKVRLKVAKIGLGEKARVTVRTKSGARIKGFIAQAATDDFTVRLKDNGDSTTILYRDVAKVDDNRGESRTKNILIAVALGAGAFIAIIGAVILVEKD